MKALTALCGLAAVCLLTACASTPSTPSPAAVESRLPTALSIAVAPPAPALPSGTSQVVPAGTVLELAIQAAVDTRTAQPKDTFPITVVRGLELDGYTVIPAGTLGHGEVVHAQKGGSFGKPAELLLAVRWIEVNDQRIGMRHFLPHTGADRTDTAGNLSLVPVAGLFSPFVHGGEIVLPEGTVAFAQVREDTRIDGFAKSSDLSPLSERPSGTDKP